MEEETADASAASAYADFGRDDKVRWLRSYRPRIHPTRFLPVEKSSSKPRESF
jgi:hypothetical protein